MTIASTATSSPLQHPHASAVFHVLSLLLLMLMFFSLLSLSLIFCYIKLHADRNKEQGMRGIMAENLKSEVSGAEGSGLTQRGFLLAGRVLPRWSGIMLLLTESSVFSQIEKSQDHSTEEGFV